MSECIAKRELLFSPKGGGVRKPFTVRIFAPAERKSGEVSFAFTEGTAKCTVEFVGLPEPMSEHMYGADTLQALQLATDVEPILRRISKKYDLFFPSGETYFEE